MTKINRDTWADLFIQKTAPDEIAQHLFTLAKEGKLTVKDDIDGVEYKPVQKGNSWELVIIKTMQ